MRNFARAWILLVVALVSMGVLALTTEWLSTVTPLGDAPTDAGLMVQALVGKLLTLIVAVLFFGLLDRIFLPWLHISDVIFGTGQWEKTGEDGVRSAVVVGWFLVFAAVIMGFAWGSAL